MTDTNGGKPAGNTNREVAAPTAAADKTSAVIGSGLGNTAVVTEVDEAPHDRVQMLSLHADGTPDQLSPEIIGPKDAALKGARTQFAEQAVSAVDTAAEPSRVTLVGQEDGSSKAIPATRDASDAGATELVEVHKAAAAAAEAAAEATVEQLHRG